MQSIKLHTEESKGSESSSNAATLFSDGVSVEDSPSELKTVRPQFGERCDCQFVCDSALGEKSDENDVELNGETDDEDMEDGETGFDDGQCAGEEHP